MGTKAGRLSHKKYFFLKQNLASRWGFAEFSAMFFWIYEANAANCPSVAKVAKTRARARCGELPECGESRARVRVRVRVRPGWRNEIRFPIRNTYHFARLATSGTGTDADAGTFSPHSPHRAWARVFATFGHSGTRAINLSYVMEKQ